MTRQLLLALIYLAFLSGTRAEAQTKSACQKAKVLINIVEQLHYAPSLADSTQSDFIFQECFRLLDPERLLFTQEQINELALYRYKLKDEIATGSCSFPEDLAGSLQQQLAATDSLIKSLLQKPLALEEKDTLWLSYNSTTTFAPTQEALRDRWNRWLKYQVLLQLSEAKDKQEPALQLSEPAVRKQAGTKAACLLQKILEHPGGLPAYVEAAFLNAIAHSYDPHTMYFSPEDRQSFEHSLSAKADSYGLELKSDQLNTITIAGLAPGGPAWKSNELHVGDILLDLRFADDEPLDIRCLSAAELQQQLEASANIPLSITVRKMNGQQQTITLTKETLEIDENVITSRILDGEKKIGYISLLGFYTSWNEDSKLGCAHDVAREILRLKKENIEGLIFDLRFNSGGSVTEAVDLAGIFIEEGPMGIMAQRETKPQLLKDMNRGTIYDGPLLVLVNSISASSSELMAAALQDYRRAVIVGSPTSGKASGQVIFPLEELPSGIGPMAAADKLLQSAGKDSAKDFIKITTGKLYRINGKTHQMAGVQPDILLPDLLDAFPLREEHLPNALPVDEIQKKVYYSPLPPLPLNNLRHLSAERLTEHEGFRQIKEAVREMSVLINDGQAVELSLEGFKSPHGHAEPISEQQVPPAPFTANSTARTPAIINSGQQQKELHEHTTQALQEDIYLAEAYYILLDLISLTK